MDESSLNFNIQQILVGFDELSLQIEKTELRQRLPLRDKVDLSHLGFDKGSHAIILINATRKALSAWHGVVVHFLKSSQLLTKMKSAALKEFEQSIKSAQDDESLSISKIMQEEMLKRDNKFQLIETHDAAISEKLASCRDYLIQFLIESIALKAGDDEIVVVFNGSSGQLEIINEIYVDIINICIEEISERKAHRALNAGRTFRRQRKQRTERSKVSEKK